VTADSTDSGSSSKNNMNCKDPSSDHHHQQQQQQEGLVGVVTVASQFHQIPEQYHQQPQQHHHQHQVIKTNALNYCYDWFSWILFFFASPLSTFSPGWSSSIVMILSS
jgi:hypothetical protein